MIEKTLQLLKDASYSLPVLEENQINDLLLTLADAIESNSAVLLEANAKDLARMDRSNPVYDRLLLTEDRLKGIASDMRHVAELESPVGKVIDERVRPNGMKLTRVRVPFGVIGVIYEARPNVSFDVFSLCFKSRNACALKGGSDAYDSNCAIVDLIHRVLAEKGIDPHVVELLPAGHEAAAELMKAVGMVDLLIPRGSARLIKSVREQAQIPCIETGAGVCHTYFDKEGDLKKGADIIFNSKTRRVSVCNALDSLVIHADRLKDLPELCIRMADKNVVIEADEQAYAALEGKYPAQLLEHATDESFGKEFLAYRMSIKTVSSYDEALMHIRVNTSHHSECIVTENAEHARKFQQYIDAACVYVNVSTAFTDGAQFGLGAEIGISTQKMHARGPMGLEEITTYKWLINGDGQTRQ
ncbi:MAG: glutamate-5-semialdehyde dehydrogenase [Bacteroidaceae bacterium]|jgi:glutamate-5-semialdehyde dehydrogenase|nr:glutamate-5-semialdehyde dehydrogenase [Bacteroidaceae bacterium]